MAVLERILDRAARRREQRIANGAHYRDDIDALGGVLAHLDVEYRLAVRRGAPRQELGRILSGMAGGEIAKAYVYRAMNWDKTSPGHSEATRLSGLLLLELSHCAAEGRDWRGVRHREFETPTIAAVLHGLTLAFDGWAPNPLGNLGTPEPAPTVAQRLGELMGAVRGVIPGQPTETLAVLAGVHEDGAR